jgi:hypothetical protein
MPGSVLTMAVPSGKAIFTSGPEAAASLSMSRHSRGFLALAILPVSRCTTPSTRSPSRPRPVTRQASTFSPSIDLTG